jgi:two-component system OmpR family sensor kinase
VVERFEDESLLVGSSLEMDLPESAVGRWDRVRLDQVLTNLLSNALKYGEQQPVAIRVETSPGMVRVCVQDRGIGIAAENQARIFERFERFASGQHYVGFGLGLWITRQIVEAQGGHVLVESEPGQGSRFVVELPTGH